MSVVGYDIGNDKCVISVARNRVIDVLQNDTGSRKTSSLVAYGSKNRLIGDAAVGQFINNYRNTVQYVKRLLGRPFDDPEMKEEIPFLSYQISKLPDGGIGINVSYNEENLTLTPEQVMGALLGKLKRDTEAGLGAPVTTCVLSCPPYWHEGQRRALIDSAAVAGLTVLRVMNDSTAVALSYGILRPLPEKDPIKVVFIDMGVSATTVAVVSFVNGKLQMLGVAWDRNLGGRTFDKVVYDHFARAIKAKYKLDVNTDSKASAKLLRESSKIKTTLSANSKVPLNIEYFMNGVDVAGSIERQEFEDLSKPLLDAVLVPCNQALKMAGMKVEDVHSVEIIGGGTRIPCVQRALQGFFKKELSKTCDSDESIAKGCTLMCAMLSPNFKVRDFDVQDVTPYGIELTWGPVSKDSTNFQVEDKTPLIKSGNPLPSIKLVSFKDRFEPFQVVARYQDTQGMPALLHPVIGRCVISGMPSKDQLAKTPEQKAPKIKVKVKLDLNGLLSVTNASLLQDVTVEEASGDAAKPVSMETDANKEKTEASMDEEPSEAPAPAAPAPATPAPSADGKAPMETEKKMVTKTIKSDLQIQPFPSFGFSKTDIDVSFEREVSMYSKDREVEETNARKNELENYVLNMKNSITSDLKEFFVPNDIPNFSQALDQIEEWLYEDGSDCMKSEYVKRINQLKEIGEPARRRKNEQERREEAVGLLKGVVGKYQMLATSADEKYAHIEAKEKDKIVQECTAADMWLSEKLSKQDRLPKHNDPIVTFKELEEKRVHVETAALTILSKPKPEPPKPEAPKPEAPKADAQPKADAPKADAEAPKADAPKADAPKADAPKADGQKPSGKK